jgi:hypothetical protein
LRFGLANSAQTPAQVSLARAFVIGKKQHFRMRMGEPPMNADQPSISPQRSPAELFTEYLRRQVAAHSQGFATAGQGGEVTPYEAVPVPPVDPRLAWEEAQAAAQNYGPSGNGVALAKAPPDWSSLVQAHEPIAAVPFCLGNYPQLVRDLHGLLQTKDLSGLQQTTGRPVPAEELIAWAEQTAAHGQFPQTLYAAAALRLAKHYDRAADLLTKLQSHAGGAWQPALANERAALDWHRGRAEEAVESWNAQPASIPVLFNRGLAALFHNRPAAARTWLPQAVAPLGEASAWHHLGRLYLALAEMRR